MILLDVTAGTVVGLLGIWAALGCGHWFLRFLAVTPLLLAPLLIPAYELVFHHSFGVILIVAGIGLYQNWRPWKWRYSSATILLTTAVAALFGAVLVNAPQFDRYQWLGFLGIGIAIASGTLACLWAVFGKRHWWLRTRVFMYCFFFLVVGGHAIYAAHLTYKATQEGLAGLSWQEYFAHCYSPEWLMWWCKYYVITAALAAMLLVAILACSRVTQWFSVGDLARNNNNRRSVVLTSRVIFVSLLVAVATLPTYLFYRLLNPTPFPSVELPVPNGYDDFVAAGEMLTDDIVAIVRSADSMPTTQLKAEVIELEKVIARIDQGLEKECYVSEPYHVTDDDYLAEQEALFRAWAALVVQFTYLRRSGDSADYAWACIRFMRFGQEASRGAGTDENSSQSNEQLAVLSLRKLLGRLSPQECRELAAELVRLDSRREPYSVLAARQRLIDQRNDWRTHLEQLITDWSGEETEPYYADYWRRRPIADTRLLIVELAIHAYLGDSGTLPQTLDDLVPSYLPAVPLDPLGDSLLNYLVENNAYKLYSNGYDRDDDGGDPENLSSSNGGDMVVTGPTHPTFLHRTIRFLKSSWIDLWKPTQSQTTAPR